MITGIAVLGLVFFMRANGGGGDTPVLPMIPMVAIMLVLVLLFYLKSKR